MAAHNTFLEGSLAEVRRKQSFQLFRKDVEREYYLIQTLGYDGEHAPAAIFIFDKTIWSSPA